MNLKKFKIFLLLISVMCFVTGCSNDNESAESVALAMVERLSDDDYEGIGELFYQDEDAYFDEKVFQKLIEDKKLNISGNKTMEVTEIGSEITNEDGYVQSKVKILIDEDRTFNLDTIEVDGKWYVYDESFYDNGIVVVVPDGATLKLNGNEVDKSYYKKTKLDVSFVHPSSTSRKITVPGFEVKAYNLPKVLRGSYDVTIESDKTVKDVLHSYSNYRNISSTNYTYELQTNKIVYTIGKEESEDNLYTASDDVVKGVEVFMKSFYDDLTNSLVNATTLDNMSKYFEKDSKVLEDLNTTYKKLDMYVYGKATPYKSSYSDYYYYYTDFKNNSTSVAKVYYVNDDTIVVATDFKLGYKYYSSYDTKGTAKESKNYSLVHLKKTSDSFVIVDGVSLFKS